MLASAVCTIFYIRDLSYSIRYKGSNVTEDRYMGLMDKAKGMLNNKSNDNNLDDATLEQLKKLRNRRQDQQED